MTLKFPNARLLVHALLSSERLSGAQAIARGACQFGLIPADSVLDVLEEKNGHQCQCLATAKNIVKKHFEQCQKPSGTPVNAEEVWSAIEKQLNNFPQLTNGLTPSKDSPVGQTSPCLNHAPALVDVMLQQIMRYS